MNPILIFHYDEAPEFLRSMAFNREGEYVIMVPTGVCETQQTEKRLNIVRSLPILAKFGVDPVRPNVTGYVGQTTHSDGIHYRVFIV